MGYTYRHSDFHTRAQSVNHEPRLNLALLLSGLVAPFQLAVLEGVTLYYTPGHDPVGDTVSRLAGPNAPHPWAISTAFVLFGVELAAFGLGVYRRLGPSMRSAGAALLIFLWGASSITAGLFRVGVDTPVLLGLTQDQLHQHAAHLAAIVVVALMAYFLAFGPRYQERRRWLLAATALTALVAFAMSVLLITRLGSSMTGIIEMTLMASSGVWLASWALSLARTDSESDRYPEG